VRPGQAVKCWPLEHWAELVSKLKALHPSLRIVQIGGTSSRPIAGVDDCLIGRIRLGEALWLLQGAALHIDGESGLVHAAYALGTPSVVLFGPTDVGFFGYRDNVNLNAGVCTPCWWSTPDWLGRCPRGLAAAGLHGRDQPGQRQRRRSGGARSRPTIAGQGPSPDQQRGLVARRRAPARRCSAAIQANGELVDDTDGHARSPTTGCYLHATKRWEYAFALDALAISPANGSGPRLRIADLGCGRGALGPWLATQGHAVTGYDRNFADDGNTDASRRFLNWAPSTGFAARPPPSTRCRPPTATPTRVSTPC
jgi:hypothetical protein